jgi:hypothetical protein
MQLSKPNFLESRSRFLLRNAMEGAKAPNQFGRIHPDDAAAGKFPLQNLQGRFVVLFMPVGWKMVKPHTLQQGAFTGETENRTLHTGKLFRFRTIYGPE